MTEALEMPEGFQLQKKEIGGRTAFCLLREGEIVFVQWDRVELNEIKRVIEQIEVVRATK